MADLIGLFFALKYALVVELFLLYGYIIVAFFAQVVLVVCWFKRIVLKERGEKKILQ